MKYNKTRWVAYNVPTMRSNSGSHSNIAVKCVDDGKEYKSISDAALAYGMGVATLSTALRQDKPARGLNFKYK